jgi:hypothetical protein
MVEYFITLNKRELCLLKEYMGYHNWSDMMVVFETNEKLSKKFKLTDFEINIFRNKVGI